MDRIYKDMKGNILKHGDKVLTIQKNGRATGGSLVEAYFLIDKKGKGVLSYSPVIEPFTIGLYLQNFEDKVFKLEGN